MSEEKTTDTKRLRLWRIAGERPRGASWLYSYGYPDIAAAIGAPPLDIVEAVLEGSLQPLALVELARARRCGLKWLRLRCGGDLSLEAQLRALRPEVVQDLADAYPPPIAPPEGLDTVWAITYQNLADLLGCSVTKVRNKAKGPDPILNLRSLSSVLDFVEANHPLLARPAA